MTTVVHWHDYLPIQTSSPELSQQEYPVGRWELSRPPSKYEHWFSTIELVEQLQCRKVKRDNTRCMAYETLMNYLKLDKTWRAVFVGTRYVIIAGEPWNRPCVLVSRTNVCEAVAPLKEKKMKSFSVQYIDTPLAERCITKCTHGSSLSNVFVFSPVTSSNASVGQESSLMVTS